MKISCCPLRTGSRECQPGNLSVFLPPLQNGVSPKVREDVENYEEVSQVVTGESREGLEVPGSPGRDLDVPSVSKEFVQDRRFLLVESGLRLPGARFFGVGRSGKLVLQHGLFGMAASRPGWW